MNRNILIGGAAVVLVLLIAGGFMLMNKKSTGPAAQNAGQEETSDTISSIRDALMGGQSFECSFADESGRTTKTSVKNGMVRADIVSADPEQAGSTIIRDKKIYFWNSKGGFTMTLPDVSTTPGQANPSGTMSQDELIESMEKFKESCKMATVDDALFTPPTDVKFQDMSSMMKAPTGASGVDQKQIEELMKKYQSDN